MKVALVYDRVNKWGGAERVIIALRKIFPDAPLFTSVYKEDHASWAKKIPVKTSFLQKIPFASGHHEFLGVLMPIAFESFNFDDYDLVVSVTSEAGKGIIVKPHTRHVSIILTPTRYLWSGYDEYFQDALFRLASLPFVLFLRYWDKHAAKRPDRLIAISKTVQDRIKKYYGLESDIIYPPLMVRTANVSSKRQDVPYFLIVSRLVPYKRIELAVAAANKARVPLKIIGTGHMMDKLKQKAGSTVEFLGQVSEEELKSYYANCKALIFPGIEDFGLTMVEAQAFGKPVIAFRAGGAEEIVIEVKTGVFLDKPTPTSLSEVLKSFKPSRYNSLDCKKNARRFSFEQFKRKILSVVS